MVSSLKLDDVPGSSTHFVINKAASGASVAECEACSNLEVEVAEASKHQLELLMMLAQGNSMSYGC